MNSTTNSPLTRPPEYNTSAKSGVQGLLYIEPKLAVITWATILLILCYIGVLANFSLVLTISLKKTLRAGAGTLIAASLFVGGMMGLVSFPLSAIFIYGSQIKGWDLAASACIADRFIFHVLQHTLSWLDTMIAINRLIALLFPHHYALITTAKVNYFQVISATVFGILLATPQCFGLAGGYVRSVLGGCQYPALGWMGNTQQSLGVYVPLTLCTTLYFVLAIILHRKKGDTGNGFKNSKDKAATAITKMSFIMFFVAVLCYLPVPVIIGAAPDVYFASVPLQLAARLLYPVGFIIIPTLMYCMSKEYRTGFVEFLRNVRHGRLVQPLTVVTNGEGRTFRERPNSTHQNHVASAVKDVVL